MNSANEFGRLYDRVCALQEAGFAQPAALATITRTSGSTFRHAGASMLVLADGEVVCELSGGCPQRDIVERTRRVLASNEPELASYNRNSGLDVLIEMGCGGELEVLIEPLASQRDVQFLHMLAQLQATREDALMATAFARGGAVLTPRPQRMVRAQRTVWSDIAGSHASQEAVAAALAGACEPASVRRIDGDVELLVERLQPAQLLILVGVNAVSRALADLAAALGWKSIVVDNAASAARPAPTQSGLLAAAPHELCTRVPLDARCAAVVLTFNIEQDLAYLGALAKLPLAYLGAIGSRERSARMCAAADALGASLWAPAGLDIGAENPQEIAVAIVAEILAQRNHRTGTSLSAQSSERAGERALERGSAA